MGFKENLMGVGFGAEKAKILGTEEVINAPSRSVTTGIVATGTVLSDAYQLTSLVNIVATTAASTGVKLPDTLEIGQSLIIQNNGASTLNVFPPTAARTINGGSAGAAVTTAAAAGNICVRLSATDFLVTVFAKES